MLNVVASARKSLGEYKPLLRYSDGSTEVCEKSPERSPQYVRGEGMIAGKRYARGTTYATKIEAVTAAQAVIDARKDEAVERYTKHFAMTQVPAEMRERMLARNRNEIATWGGVVPALPEDTGA